jgi:hypothetical protein
MTDPQKIIVNVLGQSRGGAAAIRFASEIERRADRNRIAWINVIATEPVWDENFDCSLLNSDFDYSTPEHFVLDEYSKVKHYIGIYAEDERAKDFHPIVPKTDGVPHVYRLTVPGSHQTLVGSPRTDGHSPCFDNYLTVGYQNDSSPNDDWRKVYQAVTWMVLEFLESPDFGFTDYRTNPGDEPNMLADARTVVGGTLFPQADWIDMVEDAQLSDLDEYVQTMSYLPWIREGGILGGALQSHPPGSTECDLTMDYYEITGMAFTDPRCGAKATGSTNIGTTGTAGLDWSPEVHPDGQFIAPKAATEMWWDLDEIRSRTELLQITATAGPNGSISPGTVQVPLFGGVTYNITPIDGTFRPDNVVIDGVDHGILWSVTFSDVSRPHSIHAEFAVRELEAREASAGRGGSIEPSGTVMVGSPTTFRFYPDANNQVSDVIVDGLRLGPMSSIDLWPSAPPPGGQVINKEIEVEFSIGYNLTVAVGPRAGGTVQDTGGTIDCSGNPSEPCSIVLDAGGSIDLVATPNTGTGYEFAGWTGCDQILGSPDQCRMIMPFPAELPGGNWRNVGANFVRLGSADEDGDSVPSAEEMNVPNQSGTGLGDGNGDGAPDHTQAFVASVRWPQTGVYHTIDTYNSNERAGAMMSLVEIVAEPSGDQTDPDWAYPFGILSFQMDAPWPTKRLTIHTHGLKETAKYEFRMYDPGTETWYSLSDSDAPPIQSSAVFTDFEHPSGGYASYVTLEYIDEDMLATMFGGLALPDSDRDNIGDPHEIEIFGTSPRSSDSDGDDLNDDVEIAMGLDPTSTDTNGDTIRDGDQVAQGGDPLDPDTDDDGMPNEYEVLHGLDPLVDDSAGDLDGDGVSNGDEHAAGTDPGLNESDWDDDGMPSDWEIDGGLNPTEDDSDGDLDGDGRTNLDEYFGGTNPGVIDEDSDGDWAVDQIEGRNEVPPPDRDLDGIPDWQDFDPTGYFYDERTGEIVAGGQVEVVGPGDVQLFDDGSSGYYRFIVNHAGTYTITPLPPPGYEMSTTCLPLDPPPFDPTLLLPTNPVSLGQGEDGSSGFLTGGVPPECTDLFLELELEAGDPIVINNNIALRQAFDIPDLSLIGRLFLIGAIALIGIMIVMGAGFRR